ncbi:radical SAM protein [Bellilinea sp.]|uniref:radical SAM protein n=1 Tax=Bellilinea sp. TaxID=2838785 RepID=UPI002ADDC5CF|nr:radical SAM protein [Bellilinea sp.]
MTPFEPAYLHLLESGKAQQRIDEAYAHLQACDVCPLRCGVNRLEGELGVCKTGVKAQVSSFGAHLGEEEPLRGWAGSGTIFFTRCNLRCVFCQNFEISQVGRGREVEPEVLAEIMLRLQEAGCHNINLVSPTHVVPQIIAAVLIAVQAGLRLPLVYNSGGYDSLEMLALLDGIVDIYMPDMKYGDDDTARRYSKVPRYVEVNQAAVREMQRQVGDLQLDEQGIARRGLLVRHLVLPNQLAGTEKVLQFLAEEISKSVYLNLMDQYHPAYQAGNYEELNRPITTQEYQQALAAARRWGLMRLDQRRRWAWR